MSDNKLEEAEVLQAARRLIDEKRATCLWFLKPDFELHDVEAYIRALRSIERFGNRSDYQQARRIREWLLRNSSATSAGS